MGEGSAVDAVGIVESEAPDYRAVLGAREAAWKDAESRRKLSSVLASLPAEPSAAKDDRASALRRGLALYVLGRESESLPWLSVSTARGAKLLRARALLGIGRAADALQVVGDGAKDADAAALVAEAHANLGDVAAARAACEHVKDPAEAAYLRGLAAEADGDRMGAAGAYDDAIEADAGHARALFRRARLESMHGNNEEVAIDLYRRCLECANPPVNAYLNLGNLYEDRGEFTKARECYRAVLAAEPANTRAALFDRDASAAQSMFYDEDFERRADKRSAVLRLPVTDFELSVRSRNCLAKMGVRTLGDLVQRTEAELLSYKNFGETSLQEIKDILAQKQLRLGMGREELAEDLEARSILEGIGTDADRRKALQRPLLELELSVRSRHCMNVLGLKTVGELCAKSEAELMTIKNFGQTSLNEVKQKLAELGLTLAPNPPVK